MDKKEIAQQAREFLKENRLCAFATISAERNVPQVAYMYYIADDVYRIVLSTEKHSKKLANIAVNKQVALVIGQEVEPITLQLEGIAEVITDIQEKEKLIERYAEIANTNRSNNLPPLLHLSTDSGTEFISVTVTAFKYADFSKAQKIMYAGTPAEW